MPSVDINNTQGVNISTGFPGAWNTKHDQTSGATVNTGNQGLTSGTVVAAFSGFGGGTFIIDRAMMDFVLTSIPSGATIDSAILRLHGRAFNASSASDTVAAADLILIEGTFGDSIDANSIDDFSGFAAGWDGTDSGIIEYSAEIEAGDWSTSGYNNITINSDGISAMQTAFNAGNRFKVVVMEHTHDYQDDPSGIDASNDRFGATFYHEGSGTNPPILAVTYTEAVVVNKGTISLSSGKSTLSSGKITF